MEIRVHDFERFKAPSEKKQSKKCTDEEINEKYETGEQRIVGLDSGYVFDEV